MDLGDLKYLDAPAKVLKLSEAIRIGSRLRPQCFGLSFSEKGSCAIGAAYEAVTGSTTWPRNMGIYDYLQEYFGLSRYFLRHVVATKNDEEGLSREQIADWLESQGL